MTTRTKLLICALVLAGAGGVLVARTAQALPTVQSLYSRIVADPGASLEAGVAYGPHARHVLDVYRPRSSRDAEDQDGPIAIFIYGGGWRRGERSTYGFVGAALAARGITAVIPDYRLYPDVKFPAFVEDAARAYAWTSATLASGAGKRRPIFLIGHSAGAHTAALLALDPRYLAAAEVSNEPAGLIGLAGPYAFDPTTYPSTKEIFAPAVGSQDARPVAFAGARSPPALLMHGLKDETVQLSNMRELAAALQTFGAPVRKLELADIGHAGLVLAISRPLRWRAPVLSEIEAFIRSVAGGIAHKPRA